MKNKTLFFLLIALISISCTTTLKTSTIKTMDIYGAGIIQKPTIADLDVKETKVTGKATSQFGQLIDEVKSNAVADALKNSNADVLIEPIYEIEKPSGKIIVTVTGYPATYKNFRPLKEDDIKLLESGSLLKANNYNLYTITPKKPCCCNGSEPVK